MRLSRCLFTDWDQQKSVKFVRREFRQRTQDSTWKIKKEENFDETTILQFYFKKRKKSSTFYCRKRIFTCKSNLTSFFKVYFWTIFLVKSFSNSSRFDMFFSNFFLNYNWRFNDFSKIKLIWRVFSKFFFSRKFSQFDD